jgi:hypothetical protein
MDIIRATMTDAELARSVALGNAIARRINPRPRADAAIRHMLATRGRYEATWLALQLNVACGSSEAEQLVNRLATTRANDIVTPHMDWK